jgi:Ni/Fe-hydrogenase subunit HybB-like protein
MTMTKAWHFFKGTLRLVAVGSRGYYLWMSLLLALIGLGAWAYTFQVKYGLLATGMRDEVNWGLYIGNFTFIIGITDAAVLMIIPAFIYHVRPIREIVLLGVLLAAAAVITGLLFVILDLGSPERFLHLLPIAGFGMLNFPISMLAWDVVMINGYLILALVIPVYILYRRYQGREPNWKIATPLIILSIPWAVGVHMITAFLYNGLAARPFWNASILAPRFLASAFCSGLALAILIFQVVRKVTRIRIEDEALQRMADIVVVALFVNFFLLAAELFKEYYSGTIHLAPMEYLYQGLHGRNELVPWIWGASALQAIALTVYLIRPLRRSTLFFNIACVFVFVGVWFEKSIGLIIPGFVPGVLGELYYTYRPTFVEILVTLAVWSVGCLVYTLFLKVAIPIHTGEFSATAPRD